MLTAVVAASGVLPSQILGVNVQAGFQGLATAWPTPAIGDSSSSEQRYERDNDGTGEEEGDGDSEGGEDKDD